MYNYKLSFSLFFQNPKSFVVSNHTCAKFYVLWNGHIKLNVQLLWSEKHEVVTYNLVKLDKSGRKGPEICNLALNVPEYWIQKSVRVHGASSRRQWASKVTLIHFSADISYTNL